MREAPDPPPPALNGGQSGGGDPRAGSSAPGYTTLQFAKPQHASLARLKDRDKSMASNPAVTQGGLQPPPALAILPLRGI